MDDNFYDLKVGDWVEYSTSTWLQNTAGAMTIEIVEITSIDSDGGITYESKSMHGHMGSEYVKTNVTSLKKGSVLTYWEWENSNYKNEFSISLKKHESTIVSISGPIAVVELFSGKLLPLDLREILLDNKMIDINYFKLNINKILGES